ncbi:MAG: hypothetical protein HY553_21040 [Elusimicrobia bacterium]|nr:hypothetical protein [Elusimicrobiota bacterium]
MTRIQRLLAGPLGLALVAVSPGLLPYRAAAQVVAGPRGAGAPAVAVVAPVGTAAVGAPLSPASVAPVLAPARTPAPLTVSALRAPAAAKLPALPAAPRAASVAVVAPTASAGDAAPAAPLAGADAKTQLSAAGTKLSASSDADKPRTLNAVFSGPQAARASGDDMLPVPAGAPDREHPSGLSDSDGAGAPPGKDAPRPEPPGPPEGPVKVPRALWGLLIGDVLMTIGYYMHILSQPFLVQGMTGSSAAVGVIRNIHYASYTASSFFSLGTVIDKTDYGVLMAGSYFLRALLMGAIPLLFVTGHLTLATLAVIVAINPFFQNISTTTDESSQISILGTDERVINKGKALVTKVMALANLLPLVSGLIVGSLVATVGATAGYAYAYAGYAFFLLLGVPFLRVLLVDPRHDDPNVKEKPSRDWRNLLIPIWAVFRTVVFAVGQLRRLPAAARAIREFFAKRRAAKAAEAAEPAPVGRRERLARFLDGFESLKGVAFILRNNVLWILSLVATANLFLADALDFVVMPNFIAHVLVPRLDLAHWPVIGGLLSTSAGVFTLLIIAGSFAALFVTRFFEGDSGLARIKRWGHQRLYRIAAVGSATFLLLLIPAYFLAPTPEMRAVLEQGYQLMEQPATKAAGEALVKNVLGMIPVWKFWTGLGITMFVQFMTSLLQVPLLLAMAPVRNKQIPADRVGSVITAFTIIEVVLMGLGSLVLGFVVDAVTIQTGMLVVMVFVLASAILEWLVPGWLSREKPEAWYEKVNPGDSPQG